MSTLTRFLRHQSIAILALLLACGGTSYAATVLAANSVGAKQLKKNAVTSAKIKNGQVTGADLKAGLLAPAPPARTSPLRRGETIRGQLTGDFDAPSAGADFRVSAGFPIPLAAAPVAGFVDGVSSGETCTGSYGQPTAPPDTLCVYVEVGTNPLPGLETHAVAEMSKWGFQLGWVSPSAGDTFTWSRWAYTEG